MGERLVADLVVERLRAWGVPRVFGYSGDGINGLMGALRRASSEGLDPAFVQARHEENAALMASGHAKYAGGVGVVATTQGPGAVHVLNGLYDAKLDHQPVVAIVGQQPTTALGAEYQQEIDLQALFKDVAAQFVQMVLAPEQAAMVLDRAFRTALATRSPCVVVLPHDVQVAPAPEEPPHAHGVVVTSPEWRRPRVLPRDDDLAAAAEVLNAGERVALLVGQGAREAGAETQAVAEALGAGVTTSLLGKPWWDETLPTSCGVMGHLGDRYPVEVGLTGDAAETLAALLPLLRTDRDPGWTDDVREQVTRWHETAAERAVAAAEPLSPERVVRALTPRLPVDAQVSVASRWRDWADPRFVVLVLHNQDLAEVTWEQRETEGDPRYDTSQSLPEFPYAAYADLLGLTGIRVDSPDGVGDAWDRALSADRPVVLEAVVDPEVPLLPPFPAGEEKLDSFHRALDQEGTDGAERARAGLEAQADQER